MPKPISFGKLDFEIVASMDKVSPTPEPETPFRVLIMGDFSGRTNRGIFAPQTALAERRLHLVDRDNLDELMARLGVEINLPLAGEDSAPVTIPFSELDDLHPDRLFQRLEVFKGINEKRRMLSDPSSFAKAVEGVYRKQKEPEPLARPGETEDALIRLAAQTTGTLLDQVLEETQGVEAKYESPRPPSEWDSFLSQVVQPHLVPDIEKKQAEILGVLDAATSELMRAILHYPDFQQIEAAWRGLHFLLSRVETDARLKVCLLDISKAELAADLGSADDLRATGTYRLIVEQTVQTPGAERWALIAGNYTFGNSREDIELLGRMAKIAGAANAPFIAAGSGSLLGCESLAQTPDPNGWKQVGATQESEVWEALRRLREASYLGLALPRFLLRLPYGAKTDPTERFDFDEMEGRSKHEDYLWGNPCFICTSLMAQAFSEYGWEFRPGIIQDIDGLPLHVYKEHGESITKPCAEVVLTQVAAEAILEQGLMPLLSFKNQDTVRLARFQAIADPPSHLSGQWSSAMK